MIPLTQSPIIATCLPLLKRKYNFPFAPNPTPPYPTIWRPFHSPTEWIYTDGSLKTGKSRLGASVIHSLTSTTAYIDTSGQDETHTNMRAELVAIYVALEKQNDKWIGSFTDSQRNLHVIQTQMQWPSHTAYHHHKQLLAAIVNIIWYRERLNLSTKLQKIKGHINIRETDLASTAAKSVVTSFEEISALQKNSSYYWQTSKKTTLLGHVHKHPHHVTNLLFYRPTLTHTAPSIVDHTQNKHTLHVCLRHKL
jgi:ribonuclease HI